RERAARLVSRIRHVEADEHPARDGDQPTLYRRRRGVLSSGGAGDRLREKRERAAAVVLRIGPRPARARSAIKGRREAGVARDASARRRLDARGVLRRPAPGTKKQGRHARERAPPLGRVRAAARTVALVSRRSFSAYTFSLGNAAERRSGAARG